MSAANLTQKSEEKHMKEGNSRRKRENWCSVLDHFTLCFTDVTPLKVVNENAFPLNSQQTSVVRVHFASCDIHLMVCVRESEWMKRMSVKLIKTSEFLWNEGRGGEE